MAALQIGRRNVESFGQLAGGVEAGLAALVEARDGAIDASAFGQDLLNKAALHAALKSAGA